MLIKTKIAFTNLTIDRVETYLTANVAIGSSTLTVQNIAGFAINQILIIGNLGNDGSEIIKTHTATAPTGSTITLASNTLFAHNTSTTITVINYDIVEISSAPTIAGTKTVLSTIPIVAYNTDTNYEDTSGNVGYRFVRYNNSITSTFSAYSDAIPVSGYDVSSARTIIDKALGRINKKTSEVLSDQFAFDCINDCQEEVLREMKRWSFMVVNDYSLGSLSQGSWNVSLPADIDETYTTKSIYNLRIATQNNLIWVDKEKWNDIIGDTVFTTLANSIIVGATSIVLTDSSDFESTGTITIGANSYAYTANDTSTNTLTIVSSTTTNTSGEYAFQFETTGAPQYWTMINQQAFFYPVLDAQLSGKNIYMDYYKKQVQIVNDTDKIVLNDPTLVQNYLCWAFLVKLNNGEETDTAKSPTGSSGWYGRYMMRKDMLKRKETIGRTFKLKPLLNRLDENNIAGNDSKSQRLGNFNY
jgi:hypothetical protein